jgi:kynurenine formamidase
MLLDLSHPVTDGMQVYPGDPAVHLHDALELGRDGVAVTGLSLGSHTGTHIDAPSHTVAGARTMQEVTLDELVGDALVLPLPGLREREVYGWERLNAGLGLPAQLPPIVVLDTDWARWFGTPRAIQHPALAAAAARELVARGMRVLAVDTLSPDLTDDPAGGFPVHEIVLGSNGLIVENLRGLEHLSRTARIGFFPLRLNGDGAPVRAVAFA